MRKYMIGIVVGVLLASAVVVLARNLDSPAAPASTSSYSLEDIYDRLDAGTAGSQSTFTEPAAGPGTGTMHTLNQTMAEAPALDNTNGATTTEVFSGTTYWSLRTSGGTWGPQTGTATAGSDVSGPDGSKTFNIPDGFYSGSKTCTANDAQLVAGNIKSGVDILGVTGSYTETICTGDATTADVLYPKTFSNSSSTGLTGERYRGCTCSGTLNGTRWCDNGNGTVTDLTNCLVWLKKANWGGSKTWGTSHQRAGILKAGTTGADLSDGSGVGKWRMPTKTELVKLRNGPEGVSTGNMRAFTGVQASSYWSSTTDVFNTNKAWTVHLNLNFVSTGTKSSSYKVWPVRGS